MSGLTRFYLGCFSGRHWVGAWAVCFRVACPVPRSPPSLATTVSMASPPSRRGNKYCFLIVRFRWYGKVRRTVPGLQSSNTVRPNIEQHLHTGARQISITICTPEQGPVSSSIFGRGEPGRSWVWPRMAAAAGVQGISTWWRFHALRWGPRIVVVEDLIDIRQDRGCLGVE
jgi:hypothetical protein